MIPPCNFCFSYVFHLAISILFRLDIDKEKVQNSVFLTFITNKYQTVQ